ncbi:MAG: penicillin-binding protein activator [Robiginitomaculum sp.]
MSVYSVSLSKARLKAKPFNPAGRFMRCGMALSGGLILLSGCATTRVGTSQGPYPNQPPITKQTTLKRPDLKRPDPKKPEVKTPKTASNDGLTPTFMAGKNIKRVAILLPFSAKSSRLRSEAQSMLRAAELSLFASKDDDVLLIALDSKGTGAGAKQAAQKALKQGADIILGPILAKSVKAVGKTASRKHIPVIGFSTDTSVAGNGVYLLSFPPEAEVKRVTQYAAASGATKFAFLGPNSNYGRRVLGAYRKQINDLGGLMTGVETYSGKDITVMQAPAAKLAKLYTNQEVRNKAEGRPPSESAYHAILLPESGTALRSLAPLLPFYDVNPTDVQFMGTGIWNKKDVTREPALKGGIFAGPEMEGKDAFKANYDAVFGEEPTALASLAYDAVSIATFVTDGKANDVRARLINPAGFYGVDGLVRFTPFGAPERSLAIYQVKYGRTVVIDPAPKTANGAF